MLMTPLPFSAWISSILASPVAMDPLVGTEVIKCLQTYLDLRFRAVEDLKRTEASQDDFGFDDFDFNDPALNDLIGFEPKGGSEHPASTSTASVVEATQRKDAELAKLLKNEVSPALFKLLTSLFTPSVPAPDSAPKIHQGELKADHLKDLMYAWATCASIMVYHKLRVSSLLLMSRNAFFSVGRSQKSYWSSPPDVDELLQIRRRSLQSHVRSFGPTGELHASGQRHCRHQLGCLRLVV